MRKVAPVLLSLAVASLVMASMTAGAGCSSTSSSSAPADGQAYCFATVQETAGAACQVSGLECTPSYYCEGFQQLAFCTCTSGTFQCTDQTGAPVTAGGTPNCAEAGSTGTCPDPTKSNASSTEGTACNKSGLICYFPTNCPPEQGIIPPDVCQCVGNGDGGLRFVCDPGCGQLGDGSVSDAFFQNDTSTGDDASDASTDASDAPTE
jgi:hypothetical protein